MLRSPRPNALFQVIVLSVLHNDLLAADLDAGAALIAWHLKEGGHPSPAISTVWRIL